MLSPRSPPSSTGTTAVIIFFAGAIILVLLIILILLFLKKRRSARSKTARVRSGNEFVPRLERPAKGGRYGRLEEDEEMVWSAEMGDAEGKGGYAPVSCALLSTRRVKLGEG